MATKVCMVCGEEKFHTAFPVSERGRCKMCAHVERETPSEKRCTGCGEVKPIGDFYRRYGRKYGHKSRCKACEKSARQKYADGISRRFKERHPDYERNRALRRKYGITLADYESMLSAQGGVCAICSAPPGARALAVDHCHSTGAIRGLLCDDCNTTLGRMKDDVGRLAAMVEYLERSWA